MTTNNQYAESLLVGVGKRSADAPAMAITANDAERLGRELVFRCGFNLQKTATLLNKDATKANLIDALDSLALRTKEKPLSMLVVYFSGHGAVISDKYYLILRDTDNYNIETTALEGSVLVEKLRQINSESMLVLLDCCHAGGMATPIDIPFDKDSLLNSQPNRVVLTASHASQLSFVCKPLSLFTYALVEGLAGKYFQKGDKKVTIFDLAMYVRERVYALSEKRQQPQLNVLENSRTSNFILTEYEDGNTYPPFERSFSLFTEDGKQIDTSIMSEKDEAYREQFNWILETGHDNIHIRHVENSSVVIKKVNTLEQRAGNNIINIEKIDTANFNN